MITCLFFICRPEAVDSIKEVYICVLFAIQEEYCGIREENQSNQWKGNNMVPVLIFMTEKNLH